MTEEKINYNLKTSQLKIDEPRFQAICEGRLRFLMVLGDSSPWKEGDTIVLKEYSLKSSQETGKTQCVQITHVLPNKEYKIINQGWVALSIKILGGDNGLD